MALANDTVSFGSRLELGSAALVTSLAVSILLGPPFTGLSAALSLSPSPAEATSPATQPAVTLHCLNSAPLIPN